MSARNELTIPSTFGAAPLFLLAPPTALPGQAYARTLSAVAASADGPFTSYPSKHVDDDDIEQLQYTYATFHEEPVAALHAIAQDHDTWTLCLKVPLPYLNRPTLRSLRYMIKYATTCDNGNSTIQTDMILTSHELPEGVLTDNTGLDVYHDESSYAPRMVDPDEALCLSTTLAIKCNGGGERWSHYVDNQYVTPNVRIVDECHLYVLFHVCEYPTAKTLRSLAVGVSATWQKEEVEIKAKEEAERKASEEAEKQAREEEERKAREAEERQARIEEKEAREEERRSRAEEKQARDEERQARKQEQQSRDEERQARREEQKAREEERGERREEKQAREEERQARTEEKEERREEKQAREEEKQARQEEREERREERQAREEERQAREEEKQAREEEREERREERQAREEDRQARREERKAREEEKKAREEERKAREEERKAREEERQERESRAQEESDDDGEGDDEVADVHMQARIDERLDELGIEKCPEGYPYVRKSWGYVCTGGAHKITWAQLRGGRN